MGNNRSMSSCIDRAGDTRHGRRLHMDISLSWDLGINIGHSGYPHEHKDQQGPLYGRRPQQQSANQQRVKAEITGKREEEMIISQREE